ncbi:MAG: DNRLRE domain-containing protein [Candidatus Bathyarchaeota archaeon]|nr:MAG: DNRLRE domain-containing protein [Candidatus Bathyarchaeota archaeon]
MLVIVLLVLLSASLIADASELIVETPLADTFVDAYDVSEIYGDRDYLEVSDFASGFSIIALKFDISSVPVNPEPSFRAQLHLYCFELANPHAISVHWCVNNTWAEEDLNFVLFSDFFRTSLADIVRVDAINTWFEWNVTSFIRVAREENYEEVTLALEVQDPLDGAALALFASKDQETQEALQYQPQLVLTYTNPEPPPQGSPIVPIALGVTAAIVVALLVYRFSRNRQRRPRSHKRRPGLHLAER